MNLVVSVFSGFEFMVLVICGFGATCGVWECVRQSFAILGNCGSFGVGFSVFLGFSDFEFAFQLFRVGIWLFWRFRVCVLMFMFYEVCCRLWRLCLV